jgi:hypothetical protein
MSLVFEPLSDAQLILCRTEQAWLITGMLTPLVDGWSKQILPRAIEWSSRRKEQAEL